MMTVQQLIERLQTLPPDAIVIQSSTEVNHVWSTWTPREVAITSKPDDPNYKQHYVCDWAEDWLVDIFKEDCKEDGHRVEIIPAYDFD